METNESATNAAISVPVITRQEGELRSRDYAESDRKAQVHVLYLSHKILLKGKIRVKVSLAITRADHEDEMGWAGLYGSSDDWLL